MPYDVTFQLGSFNGPADAEESHENLAILLNALVAVDTNYLRRRVGSGDGGQNPAVPLLYASGVRYEEEPIGAEFWRDIQTILRYRDGDCEELVAWQVAELRVRYGIDARPLIIPQLQPNGKFLYHIQTWTPAGVDDPSARLGMRVAQPSQLGGRFNNMLRAAWARAA